MFTFHSSHRSLADAALLERFFGAEAEDVWARCASWSKVLELARDPHTVAWQALANALEILHRGLSEELAAPHPTPSASKTSPMCWRARAASPAARAPSTRSPSTTIW